MTSRPGQLERPTHARTLSRPLATPSAVQRPSPHRSLSQQYISNSPSRRTLGDGVVDLTVDTPDGTGTRTIPRSRLNLEIGQNSSKGNIIDAPKSSADLTSSDKALHPVRGRPRLHADFNVSIRGAQDGGPNGSAIKPMPLPPRPGKHALPNTVAKAPSVQAGTAKKDARPKPYTLEVPSAAPSFAPNGFADFTPWTGNHPEDQFSENVIRQGYYDKAQMTQNETGTGKSAIFPALKHKSGLHTLSSIFMSVMAQRRLHGQITSASTFKPPPRVTVTDTKREIWLKDLANPTIPLRRLSRSIPHGIRGKVLLDQSLSKNIPIERAVWLAKCVGANELRSFRRKGVSGTLAMGGETKWIRDFTICVEQFVEGVIGTCGEKEFKNKINYAIRLATHFHTEHLLDREHYMDWLLTSLESTPQAKLPVWLLITQIYWKDILQFRKYGHRLSAALLNHLAEAHDPLDQDILAPLFDRLKAFLKNVITSSPDSFVQPAIWLKHYDLLSAVYGSETLQFKGMLEKLNRRNSKLSKSGAETELNARRQLVRTLDSTLSTPFSSTLSQELWELDSDKRILSQTILEWATSLRRPGVEKIFVAVRCLRAWGKLGLDITEDILHFLASDKSEATFDRPALYHLVSELARSNHFLTASYLQWLIARGGIHSAGDVAEGSQCATRLVAELPTNNLSEKLCDLRATLLSRADSVIDDEEEHIQLCMAMTNRALVGMPLDEELDLDEEVFAAAGTLEHQISIASRTTKSELGVWLRHKVKVQVDNITAQPVNKWGNVIVGGEATQLTLSDFDLVKQCLVLAGDYSMLADVLKMVSTTSNAEILAGCADALNLYLHVFAAIGALQPLFEMLAARVHMLAQQLDSIPRVLLVSLSDLALRIPEQKEAATYLLQELARSDRKTAADACSPVSDHMAFMQTAESDFSDEIERVLASGTSMDRGTMERLFQRIILRLEESFDKTPEQQRSNGLLLTRLKTFDAESFTLLMTSWVARFLQLRNRPSMIQILGPLISFGCLALPDVIKKLISTSAKSSADISQEALTLVLGIHNVPEAMSAGETCRLMIKQSHLCQDHPHEVLFIIRRAVLNVNTATKEDLSRLRSRDMENLLQKLVLTDTELVISELIKPLIQTSEPAVLASINSLVDRLLVGDLNTQITAETILELADDLSLPFCQLKLATMFTSSDSVMTGTEDNPSDRFEAFNTAIESAVSAGRTSWSSIVPLLDLSISKHLRQRATTQFLAMFPSLKAILAGDVLDLQQSVVNAKNLLHVINATAYSMAAVAQSGKPANTVAEIPLALHNTWLILANAQVDGSIKDTIIISWLPLLLSFTSVHRQSFDNTKPGNENRGKTIITLAAIYLELESRNVKDEAVTLLAEQVYDMALYLVDSLPEEVRLQCIRSLRDTISVARIRYVFSVATNPSEWLVLMQKERLGSGPQAANTSSAANEGAKFGEKEKLTPYPFRRWEMLGEPTPNVGENDTSLSLTLFGAQKG